MKYCMFVVAMLFAANVASAANGDLIVNGNLGVGTNTPAAKAEVNGNMIVDGNLGVGTVAPSEKAEINGNLKVDGNLCVGGNCPSADQNVNGNLCVGGNCTSTLHVSGGLYGHCVAGSIYDYQAAVSPAYSVIVPTSWGSAWACKCPEGYTLMHIGNITTQYVSNVKSYVCRKN